MLRTGASPTLWIPAFAGMTGAGLTVDNVVMLSGAKRSRSI